MLVRTCVQEIISFSDCYCFCGLGEKVTSFLIVAIEVSILGGQPFSSIWALSTGKKKKKSSIWKEFPVIQSVLIASSPVFGHLWDESCSVIFTPHLIPHQVFIYIDKISLSFLFSRLNNTSSLSMFSYEMLQCLDHLCVPWLTLLGYVCVSVLRRPDLDPALQRCLTSAE